MKTTSQKPTRSTANAHNEHPASDTNRKGKLKKYRVHLYWTHTDEAFITVKAKSLAEAKKKAWQIESDILTDDDLNPISGEIDIDSVEAVEGGQSHE